MSRFRLNLVIDGVDAFEEDFLATIQAGSACLQLIKLYSHCRVPSINQATSKYAPDPLDILMTCRINPRLNDAITFGVNTILLEGDEEIL